MNRTESDSPQDFSARQGQYLAFIHAYTSVNGRPPAQSDIARFFRVTPPTVHQMISTLEKAGSLYLSTPPNCPTWHRDMENLSKPLC